jgi:8-oxo-dGTP pyrophosphatase MutT (NUDIX family)
VLLLDRHELSGRVLRGRYFETDFASFLAWRDWGFPDADVKNCPAQGALRSADGAFLLGVMGPQTANAGRIYFPSGTPDPNDVVGDTVDLDASVRREVAEETGLLPHDYASESGWHAVLDGPRLALIRVLHAPVDAATLCTKIRAHLAKQDHPELQDVRTVRDQSGLDPMMPSFVTAFLSHVWAEEAS